MPVPVRSICISCAGFGKRSDHPSGISRICRYGSTNRNMVQPYFTVLALSDQPSGAAAFHAAGQNKLFFIPFHSANRSVCYSSNQSSVGSASAYLDRTFLIRSARPGRSVRSGRKQSPSGFHVSHKHAGILGSAHAPGRKYIRLIDLYRAFRSARQPSGTCSAYIRFYGNPEPTSVVLFIADLYRISSSGDYFPK